MALTKRHWCLEWFILHWLIGYSTRIIITTLANIVLTMAESVRGTLQAVR